MKIIKILAIILLVLAIIASCTFGVLYLLGLSGLMPKEQNPGADIRVACIGDSVTYGHGIMKWHLFNYPAQLSVSLGEEFSVQNFGVSGTTVQDDGDQPYTQTKQYKLSLEYKPRYIMFMLGSNDSKAKNWKGADAFREAYIKLLDTYIQAYPGAHIYIGTPPKAFFTDKYAGGKETSFEIQPDVVEEIVEIVREIALEKDLDVIDVYSMTEYNRELFISDGVHPNAEGAREIAKAVMKKIAYRNE